MNTDKIHVVARAVIIDEKHILLCKTTDLKNNFYYLPGGHVEHNESAESALMREILEETGADCKIKRFLGCLEYIFEPKSNSICHNHEYNIIFEVSSEQLAINIPLLKIEEKLDLHWVKIEQLNNIDFRALPLKNLIPKWLNLELASGYFAVNDLNK